MISVAISHWLLTLLKLKNLQNVDVDKGKVILEPPNIYLFYFLLFLLIGQ